MVGRRLGVCVALGASLLMAGVANAAALAKFKDWDHWPTPGPSPVWENPNVDGVAILKYKQQTNVTTLHVVMHRLVPNTAYAVYLFDNMGGPDQIFGQASEQLVTDEDGTGTFQGECFGMPVAPEVYILRVPEGGTENWDNWFDQIRAHAVPDQR